MTHPYPARDTPTATPLTPNVEGSALTQDAEGTALTQDVVGTALTQDVEGSALTQDAEGTALTPNVEGSALTQDAEGMTPAPPPVGPNSAPDPEGMTSADGPEGIPPAAASEGKAPDGTTPGGTPPAPPPDGTTPAPGSPADLHDRLTAHLDGSARAWLDRALDEAAAQPGLHGPISVWELRLAEAGRRCGAQHADAARVLIMHSARAGTDALTRVYSQGTAAERRSVLNALPHLVDGPDALPLIEDALRTNDTRILAAAVGPYAARHLAPHHWRHAVLKCLFTGVPVTEVADLARRARADAELARMLRDYAAERTAAGRPVPEDLDRVLTLTDPMATPPAQTVRHGAHGTDGKES